MAIHPTSESVPSAVLDAARAGILALSDQLTSRWSDDELVEGVVAIQQHRSALDALEATLLAEVDVREVPRKTLHWGSTADWFTHLAGLHRREGRRRVRNARILAGERTATLDSLRRGETSAAQAAVIVDAVEELPCQHELRDRAEAVLLEQSKTLTATELLRAGRHVVSVVDPDREQRLLEAALDREERAAHLQRFLSVVGDGAGGVRIKGRGSAEDGEIIRAALVPLTKPAPALDPRDPADATGGGTERPA